MSLEQAEVLFLLMLVAQVPLLIGSLVNFFKSRESAKNAAAAVEVAVDTAKTLGDKIDDNTATTEAVNTKADTIVEQTDGAVTEVRELVTKIAERVAKLEDYNHSSTHRMIDAVNTVHLKLAEMVALQQNSKEQK